MVVTVLVTMEFLGDRLEPDSEAEPLDTVTESVTVPPKFNLKTKNTDIILKTHVIETRKTEKNASAEFFQIWHAGVENV